MVMEPEKKAEGIYLAGRFSQWKVGAWILHSGNECAVMEMPPSVFDDENPVSVVKNIIKKRGWICKYLLFSHPHWDHTASIAEYRKAFPDAIFVVHYSAPLFFKMSEYYWTSGYLLPRWSPWAEIKEQWGKEWYNNFEIIFKPDIYELYLDTEPLYLIYAPKHSLGDVHCVFKGVLFSGDWWIYEGDPCEDLAASSKAEYSINRLLDFIRKRDYIIHSIFSAHADNLFFNIDVHDALKRTLEHHLKVQERIPDFKQWREFGLDVLYRHFNTIVDNSGS